MSLLAEASLGTCSEEELNLSPSPSLGKQSDSPPESEWSKFKKKQGNYLTAPFDPRFPNANQTRNCYQNYLDYYRCTKILEEKGKDVKMCDWYRRVFKSLCPISWIKRWDDERAEGSFAGKI